jgi:hypothetical protein
MTMTMRSFAGASVLELALVQGSNLASIVTLLRGNGFKQVGMSSERYTTLWRTCISPIIVGVDDGENNLC